MSQVTRLRMLTEEANLYCAVPLIFRMSELLGSLEDAEGRIPSNFNYMSFRFVVGPPSRYEAAGSAGQSIPYIPEADRQSTWQLTSSTYYCSLAKRLPESTNHMNARTHGGAVEDYSLLTMQTEDGVIGLVETDIAFPVPPTNSANSRSLLHRTVCTRNLVRTESSSRQEHLSAGTRSRRLQLDTDVYYPLFVKRVLAECQYWRNQPIASLRDAELMMQVMDAAYASAQQGGVSIELDPVS